MPYLIDGHNLIGQMRSLSLTDPDDEEKLIKQLRAVADKAQKRITVVFDPSPHDDTPALGNSRTQHGRVTVIFAPAGKKADDIIRLMVGEVKDKQGLIVVTSDAAVADFTRRCGIRVQNSTEFDRWMQRLLTSSTSPHEKPVGNSHEVVNWADVFKEPEPSPSSPSQPKPKPAKKKLTRSEQLKLQVKRIHPLK